MLTTQFQLSVAEIDAIIHDCPIEWQVSVTDDQLSIEQEPRQDDLMKKKDGDQGGIRQLRKPQEAPIVPMNPSQPRHIQSWWIMERVQKT